MSAGVRTQRSYLLGREELVQQVQLILLLGGVLRQRHLRPGLRVGAGGGAGQAGVHLAAPVHDRDLGRAPGHVARAERPGRHHEPVEGLATADLLRDLEALGEAALHRPRHHAERARVRLGQRVRDALVAVGRLVPVAAQLVQLVEQPVRHVEPPPPAPQLLDGLLHVARLGRGGVLVVPHELLHDEAPAQPHHLRQARVARVVVQLLQQHVHVVQVRDHGVLFSGLQLEPGEREERKRERAKGKRRE